MVEHGKQSIERTFYPLFLVSKRTKWNSEKPHTQIEMPPKFRPAVHPPPSFARFCETHISSKNIAAVYARLYLISISDRCAVRKYRAPVSQILRMACLKLESGKVSFPKKCSISLTNSLLCGKIPPSML